MKVISKNRIPIKIWTEDIESGAIDQANHIMARHTKLNRKCSSCERQIDDRGKSGLCVKCCRLGKMNPFYGKKHTIKTRQLMKEKAKQRDKMAYYKIPMTTEMIRRIAITKKRNWNKLTIEEKHKKLENWMKAGKRKKGTKIEKIMQKVLDDIGMIKNIDYKTNVYINGFNVDILVHQEFIIECYGDYWHKNPKYYNDKKSIKKRKSDLKRKIFLESKGYEFINFWENDIYNNLKMIKKQLTIFFRSYINLFEWESCHF